MRLLFGMVIGALLTVGAAYVHDMGLSSGSTGVPAAERPMVNWDVVGETWRELGSRVREQWNRITS